MADQQGAVVAQSLLAVSWSDHEPDGLAAAVQHLSRETPVHEVCDGRQTWAWTGREATTGPADLVPASARVVALQAESRGPSGRLSAADCARLSRLPAPGQHVLPPFAVALGSDSSTLVSTDGMGFRQVYVATGAGWAALSTSAGVLGRLAASSVDEQTVALQSLLGWQAGAGTAFTGVSKLPAGATAEIGHGRLRLTEGAPLPAAGSFDGTLDEAVSRAADVVREGVAQALADHPELLLQLTGGLDSRILLAAVPREERSRLSCLTLAVPGSPDLRLAEHLVATYGMSHRIIDLSRLGDLDPATALEHVLAAARDLDGAADPLALAALRVVEGPISTAPRLSGLGGEVVRGFYYVPALLQGSRRDRQVDRLAAWRLFPNEQVPDDVISPRLRAERRARALAVVHELFDDGPSAWPEATDLFYLRQRMQRWAGVLASATAGERVVVNPMLDPRFLELGASLPTAWKARARFLSRILVELDPELATIPLDGRPAPSAYAHPDLRGRLRFAELLGRKVVGKARQRLSSTTPPPAGGAVLADLVVQAWRDQPSRLEGVRRLDCVDREWLDQVLAGRPAGAGAVAFVVNQMVLAEVVLGCDPQGRTLRPDPSQMFPENSFPSPRRSKAATGP
jgi:asparagine synthase (glutamine-hydrolysing)